MSSGCLGEEMQQCPGLILVRLAHAKQPGRAVSLERMGYKECRRSVIAPRCAPTGYFACKATGGGGVLKNLKRMGVEYQGNFSKITLASG
jgi:hypothetical protein